MPNRYSILVSLVSILFFFSGCGTNRVVHKNSILKDNNRLIKKLELPVIEGGRSLLLIGDNQLSNIYTDASIFGMRLSDMVIHVAIRPPALNLFSPSLTRYLLKKYSVGKYVLHMGDALNISCKNEWNEFHSIMDGVQNNGWIMVPGNHDSFFYGVTNGGWFSGSVNSNWKDGCVGANGSGDRFGKNDFIANYLDHLKSSLIQNIVEDKRIGLTVSRSGMNPVGFFKKVVVYEYKKNLEHRSFIVQFVNLSTNDDIFPVIGVLVDTTNYRHAQTNFRGSILGSNAWLRSILGGNAGINGHIGKDQIREIRETLKSFGMQNLKIILIGHHDYNSLNSEARVFFEELSNKYKIQGYISAHTHSGFVKSIYTENDPSKELCKEYNIGSIIDWPLQVGFIENGQSKIRRINTFDITDASGNVSTWCNPEYDYSTSRLSNYTAYRRDSTSRSSFFRIGQQAVNAQQKMYIVALRRAYYDLDIKGIDNNTKDIYAKLVLEYAEDCWTDRSCQDRKRKLIYKAKEKIADLINAGKLDESDFLEYASCQTLFSSKAEYLSINANHESNLDEK